MAGFFKVKSSKAVEGQKGEFAIFGKGMCKMCSNGTS